MASMQRVLSSSATARASGRVVVKWKDDVPGADDIILQDRDNITIPRAPSSVGVLGQVYNPTAIVSRPSLTLRNYR